MSENGWNYCLEKYVHARNTNFERYWYSEDEGSGIMWASNTGYPKTHPQPQCPEHGFTGGLSEQHAQLREFPKQYDDPLQQNGLNLCGRQKMTRRSKTATPR